MCVVTPTTIGQVNFVRKKFRHIRNRYRGLHGSCTLKCHAHAHYNSIAMTSCEPTHCSAYSEDLRCRIVWQTEALHYTSQLCLATLSQEVVILLYCHGIYVHALSINKGARTVQTLYTNEKIEQINLGFC